MQVTILLFATLKDIVGSKSLTLQLDDTSPVSVGVIRAELIHQYPQGEGNFRACIASLNEEFAFDADAVKDGDTLAFFPPVSGGSSDWPEIFRVTEALIDHDALIAEITTVATGAVCLFSGMVRGSTSREGHMSDVEYLEYEAYETMAVNKMRQVAQEIRQQWPKVQGIAIVQRVGKLRVGENTVLIACSSGHRDEGCFEAARYGIDRLKEIVPVWKKEIGAENKQWIEGGYTPSPQDRHTNS